MTVLGVSAVGTISLDIDYAQSAGLNLFNNKAATWYPNVVDSTLHNVKPDDSASVASTEVIKNVEWTYSTIEADGTEKGNLYVSAPFQSFYDESGSVLFSTEYLKAGSALAETETVSLQEIAGTENTDRLLGAYGIFSSNLAILKNNGKDYYGYVGYKNDDGEFVRHSLLGMQRDGVASGEWNYSDGDEIVFCFEGIDFQELGEVEVGIVDGMVSLRDETVDSAEGNQSGLEGGDPNTIGGPNGIQSWEQLEEQVNTNPYFSGFSQVEFISLSGENNDSLNNKPVPASTLYKDPMVDGSFELTNVDSNSVDISFQLNTSAQEFFYQEFAEGAIDSVDNNIQFYAGAAKEALSATLKSSSEAGDIKSLTYEVELQPDSSYEDFSVDISYENDDGVINSFGEAIPKTRSYQVSDAGEVISTTYSNPFDLSSAVWNDDKGQIIARIPLNNDPDALPVSTLSDEGIRVYYKDITGGQGTFGKGATSDYNIKYSIASDNVVELIITNPSSNNFIPISEIGVELDTNLSDPYNTPYTYSLKTYSGDNPIGNTSLIKSISSYEIQGDKIALTLAIDSVNDSASETAAELESENLTFGYDSVAIDDAHEIDSDANPIHPTTGSEFGFSGMYDVQTDGTNWFATVDLDIDPSVSTYSNLWVDVPGVFRMYDLSGTTITNDLQNPIVGNSGEATNITETSATISFYVNNKAGQYAVPDFTSAKFSASNVDPSETITVTYDPTATETFADGTTKVSYDFEGLTQGKQYQDIKVYFETYEGGIFEDLTPRLILGSLQTQKLNPIIENSGSIISMNTDSVVVSFDVHNETSTNDQYADYIVKSAEFDADGFNGTEITNLIDNVDNGDTTTLTYRIDGIKPNTQYSNLTVYFQYIDSFEFEPTTIIAGSVTTDRLNPIVEGSGIVKNISSDSMVISFQVTEDEIGEDYYAKFDPTTLVLTGDGLTGSETIELLTKDPIKEVSSRLEYQVSGLNPGTTYSDIYANFTFDDGYTDDPVLIIGDSFETEKLNPIIVDSGEVSNITNESATISFKVNEDAPGEDIYADYIANSGLFSFSGITTTEVATYSGKTDNGDGTSTLTYELKGLEPNKTYGNVNVKLGYYDGFASEYPTRIVDSFTTLKDDPIIEETGVVISTTQDSAVISFGVHEDEFGEDKYADYTTTGATFYSTSNGGIVWEGSDVKLVGEQTSSDELTTTLMYEITGLTPNTPYTEISVDLDFTDGSEYEPTQILGSFTTKPETQDPVILTSFEQVDLGTTQNQIQFEFQYRHSVWDSGPEVAKVGYELDGDRLEFDFDPSKDITTVPPTPLETRTTATVTIDGLETNTLYSNVWLELEDGTIIEALAFNGNPFSVRTLGLNPIIDNSGEVSNVTDTAAQVSFEFHQDALGVKGDYYTFDVNDVKIGYVDDGEDVTFPSKMIGGNPSVITITNEDGVKTKKVTYDVTGLNPGTTYADLFVIVKTNDGSGFEFRDEISQEGITTLGANPVLEETISIENIVPSNGTEAQVSYLFRDNSTMMSEDNSDASAGYSTIDPEKTLVGYEGKDNSMELDNSEKSIADNQGGYFETDEVTVNGIAPGLSEVLIHITGLDENVTYTGIFIQVYNEDGELVSKVYATDENADFKPIPSDALPMTFGEVMIWIIVALIVFFIIWLIIFFGIRYAKKHFALAIFMDGELSMDESEIVFNLINVKHKKKLWDSYEGNLVLYAAGKKIDAIFKRSTELHNGYKIYITEDFNDKDTILSLLNSTKYNKFSVGLYKDHHRYHVTEVPDHKISKLVAKLDRTDAEHYEDVVHEIVDHLDDEHIEERIFDSIEGFISGINRRKSTDKTLRYQAIVPHDHSLNHDLFFEENDVSFWHVFEGKLYELKYEFVNRFGSLIEVDLVGLKPGTAYVGLTMSFDKGKTFVPSSTVYGVTRDEDGVIPNLTNAKLGGKTTGAKSAEMWDEQTCIANVGERLSSYHKRVITKSHYENDDQNKGKIISLHNADQQYKRYIEKWWKEAKEKPIKKATKSKTAETKVDAKKTTTKK